MCVGKSARLTTRVAERTVGGEVRERETTQAIVQQHTSPLRAGCEARRREVVLIFCCGKSLVRYGPGASEVDGRFRAGGPQGL